jgi:hypothetical protein
MDEPQSPVDVILGIRKELKEFQQNSSPQALRAEWKAACEAALRLDGPPDEIIEYLEYRGLVRAVRKRERLLHAKLKREAERTSRLEADRNPRHAPPA